jgi:hypothetical protein
LALVDFNLHVELGLGAAELVESDKVVFMEILELFLGEVSLDVGFFELFLDVVKPVCDDG